MIGAVSSRLENSAAHGRRPSYLIGGFGLGDGAEAHAPARALLLGRGLVVRVGAVLGRFLGVRRALHLGPAIERGRVVLRLLGLAVALRRRLAAFLAGHEAHSDALDRFVIGPLALS